MRMDRENARPREGKVPTPFQLTFPRGLVDCCDGPDDSAEEQHRGTFFA